MMASQLLNFPDQIASLHPDPVTRPFWDAAREHRLVVARCVACATIRPMPPGPFCWECREVDVEWVTLPGTASVHTFTIVRSAPIPELSDAVPYVIAVVELDDAPGVRLMTNVVCVAPDDVRIGMRLRVVWDDVDGQTVIPRFTAAD
jgi:uncharacterized OB-fold protein